jgi:hypothetical protein
MIIMAMWQQRSHHRPSYFPPPDNRKPLVLTAYTYFLGEIEAFKNVLEGVGVETGNPLQQDAAGKFSQQSTVPAERLERLEKRLDVFFVDDRDRVVIIPGRLARATQTKTQTVSSSNNKKDYCCHELTKSGDGDALPIEASDDVDALFVCGLLGGQRRWFGAKPVEGECPR